MAVKLRTKRIVATVVITAVLAGLAVAYLLVKNADRARFVAQARADGLVAYAEGNYEMALGKLGFYVRREPADLQALLAFADARSRVFETNSRHLPHAAHIYLSALDLDPESRESLEGLMRVYDQLGWRMEWMDIAQRMLALDPDHLEALRLMAHGYYFGSDFERCTPFLDRLISLDPDDLQWRTLKLHVMAEQGATAEEQVALCRTWMDDHPTDSRYHMLKALILAASGDVSGARDVAREGVERGLGAATESALSEMLRVLTALQMESEAATLLVQTKLRHPSALWAHEQSVRRLWQLGRISEALDEVWALANDRSLSPALLQHKCMLLLMAGEIDRGLAALSEFEQRTQATHADQRDADRGWLIAMRARLQLAEHDLSAATHQYYAALGLSPGDARIHFFLGEAHAKLGEHERASHYYERASQIDPHWLSAQIGYVQSRLAAGYARGAWQRLLKIIEREAAHPYLYVLLAEAWLAAEEPTDKLPLRGLAHTSAQRVHLTDVLRRLHEQQPGPRVTDVFVRMALRYGHEDLAHMAIEQALNAADDRPDAGLLTTLARRSMDHGLGHEQVLIERAKQQSGMTPELAAVVARWHHLQGRTDEGLKVIDNAFAERHGEDTKIARLRLRASYLAECYDRRTVDALAELFAADSSASTAGFVLAHPAVWTNAQLARRAMDVLASQVGEDSPRVGLARATYVLHHHADDPVRVAEAQVWLNDALRVSPDSLAALNLMVDLSLAGERPEPRLATTYLKRAIESHPNRADLHIRLIRLLQQQGDFTAAQHRLDRFAEIASLRQDLLETRLALLELQGDYQQVANLLLQSVDASSTEAERVRLVLSLRLAGEHDKAQQALQELLDAPDTGELTIQLAADFYAAAGDFSRGLTLLETAAFGCEIERQIAIGNYLLAHGRADEAAKRMQQTWQSNPENVPVIARLAAIRAQQGDAQAAFDTAVAGMANDATNTELRMIALTTAALLGPQERARVRELLGDSSESGPFIKVLHLLERSTDGAISSRDELGEAARLAQQNPESLLAWRTAIALHVQAGAVEEAIRLARRSASALPRFAEPAQIAAELHAQAGQWLEALEMARLWRQRTHHRPYAADIFIARVLLALDRPQQAAALLEAHGERVIAEGQQHPQPLRNWISAMLLTGEVEAAVQRIDSLLRQPGPFQGQWFETTRILDRHTAERALAAIETHLLQDAHGMLTLASAWGEHAHRFDDDRAHARSDDLANRAAAVDAALAVPALLLRAQSAERRSHDNDAETLYRKALSLAPSHAVAMNNLAALLHKDQRNCAEALMHAAKAAELAPHIPELHHTHANALICMEDYLTAEASARRALALRDRLEFQVTLGVALALQGKTDEAESVLFEIERRLTTEAVRHEQQSHIDRLRRLVGDDTSGPVAIRKRAIRSPFRCAAS